MTNNFIMNFIGLFVALRRQLSKTYSFIQSSLSFSSLKYNRLLQFTFLRNMQHYVMKQRKGELIFYYISTDFNPIKGYHFCFNVVIIKNMQARTTKVQDLKQLFPPHLKSNSKNPTSQSPHLNRTISHDKSFRKAALLEKSTKEKQIQKQIKYTNTNKMEVSFQKSIVRSEKNLGLLRFKRPFEETATTFNIPLTQSKAKKGNEREAKNVEKIDSTRPFDVLSGISASNQYRNNDKNEEFYMYWKNKAYEYLEVNLKLMEDIRRLTKENEQLTKRIQNLQISSKPVATTENKSSTKVQKQMSRQNSYLLEKMEQLQVDLKKKQIVIKSYEEKIAELNSKVVGDNERTRLINKLKSEIDTLRTQLNRTSLTTFASTQSSAFEEKLYSWKMQMRGSTNSGR